MKLPEMLSEHNKLKSKRYIHDFKFIVYVELPSNEICFNVNTNDINIYFDAQQKFINIFSVDLTITLL